MLNRKTFFDGVRMAVFHGMTQQQVDGTNALLDEIEKVAPNLDHRFIAYMLATTYWETARTMQPIEEIGHGRGRAYGVPTGVWHQVYFGRGDVQLTWEGNYHFATKRLHELGVLSEELDLERTPQLALRSDIAAAILIYGMLEGWFTKKKLGDFFHGPISDWVNARTIVNGHDHAAEIAHIAMTFHAALVAEADAPKLTPLAVPAKPKGRVIGDSIAKGVDLLGGLHWGGDYLEGRSYALIEKTEIPDDIDVLLISTLTNPQPKTPAMRADLLPSLQRLRARVASHVRVIWILPSPRFATERGILQQFASSYGDATVGFAPGPDGIHPKSYSALAHDVLALLHPTPSNVAG